MNILKKIKNYSFFIIFGVRIFTRKKMREIADSVKENDKILEIGSGKKCANGDYYFSAIKYFEDKKVDFIMSDIITDFGHKIVDIVNLNEIEKYDHILCFNVLEHVFDWQIGIENLFRALKKGGNLHIIVPVFYPIHDSPSDYFRFTKNAFEEFFKRKKMKIENFSFRGFSIYPSAYYFKIMK